MATTRSKYAAFTGKYAGVIVLLNSFLLAVATAAVGLMWFLHDVPKGAYEDELFLAVTVILTVSLAVMLFVIYPVVRLGMIERLQIGQRAQSLEKQATTDPLTGMHNRRYFEEALRGYLREFNRIGASLGLLILDLDHFKSVNDNYGHDVGDIVLKEVALRMRAISREHDIVARLGGEEFAVITPYASFEQLRGVAERYRQMVEALRIKNGNIIIRPTVSIGVATNEGGVDNADDLYKAADKKLYQAKNAGRNRVAA
jgi:diguanylate cyclase (GGDEF)-like protein